MGIGNEICFVKAHFIVLIEKFLVNVDSNDISHKHIVRAEGNYIGYTALNGHGTLVYHGAIDLRAFNLCELAFFKLIDLFARIDATIISLFNELILPCFTHPEKVEIICADAFEFAEKEAKNYSFDYIFADIWHDPTDGIDAYKRFKELEQHCPSAEFDYWIEKTLKLYM